MLTRLRFTLLLYAATFASVAWGDVFRVGLDVHCTHTTLAAALAAAVANGPGRDEIRLAIDVQTTQAHFLITQTDVLIAGGYTTCGVAAPGASARSLIVGNGHDSVFYIGSGRNVELRQLAITNGGRHGMANGDFAVGGAIWLNGGVAILRGIRVMNNRARLGGGLATSGNSVMVIYGGDLGSTIEHNEAMLGGGIYVGERATLRMENDNVSVVHNSANGSATAWDNSGGGIYAIGGASSPSTIDVSWLDGDPDLPMPTPRGFLLAHNTTTGNGGGMTLSGTASFMAIEAAIRNNTASGWGGGLFLYGNQLGAGASAYMHRRPSFLPWWLRNCDGRYGCNAITGNTARTGGGIMVMHGELRLGQMLMAGNHSTGGGGAAIQTGNIANVPSPVNRIWLDSMVIADNHCTGPTPSSSCSTLGLSAGPNQVHIQHATLADNVLSEGTSGGRYEIYSGPSPIPLVLRSTIIEPEFGVTPAFSVGPIDGDCVMAPSFSAIGTRALVRSPPYGFVSRADFDYRPAAGDIAIDACDTSQLLESDLSAPDLIAHGSVDDPSVPNRLGPESRADIGAFEKTIVDLIFRHDFEP